VPVSAGGLLLALLNAREGSVFSISDLIKMACRMRAGSAARNWREVIRIVLGLPPGGL